MNKEMKKILSRYIFGCVVLTCLMCFCAGIITARQRSEYNSYFTPYAVMSLKSSSERLTVTVDDKDYNLNFEPMKKLSAYRRYLYFTPFSCAVFFTENIFDVFNTFKG